MVLGEIKSVEGFDKVKDLVQSVLFRKNAFIVFEIGNADPVTLNPLENLTCASLTAKRANPSEEQIKTLWEKFSNMCKDNKNRPFYAVYDFGYYNNGLFRTSMVLCSYIPDSEPGLKKMIYSTNVQSLKDAFNIPFLFQANSLEDFDYEKFKHHIENIQVGL